MKKRKQNNLQKVSWKHDIRMNWSLYILFLPIFLYFVIFNYAPMFGIVSAFQNFSITKGFFGSKWVGLQNFIDFFTGPSFFSLLRNTLVISSLDIFVGMTASIVFALLLNEIYVTKFKKTVQTISYMPHFISTVVMAGFIIEFVASNGAITNLLVSVFGIQRENLLSNPRYFWGLNLVSNIWQGMGYGSIIYMAALSGVSQEQHEAAAIDGAGRLHRVWHITLPAIRPTIVTMLVLRLGMAMTVGADKILLLYNPSIYETADVISTHVVRMGIERMQFGYSSAVGLFNSLIGLFLLVVSNALSRKLADTSLY